MKHILKKVGGTMNEHGSCEATDLDGFKEGLDKFPEEKAFNAYES